jgi:hypothetical protein
VFISQLWLIAWVAFASAAFALLKLFYHAGLGIIACVAFVYLSALMLTIANLLDYPRLPRHPRASEIAKELEKRNLLAYTHYRIERAFRVAELNGEGPHYFLELESGGILHLSGHYLYNYEPGEGPMRYFPCTHFTLRRHLQLGQAVDILCDGLVIEPEAEAPPYSAHDFDRGVVPKDGEILRHVTFDQLLGQLTPRRQLAG